MGAKEGTAAVYSFLNERTATRVSARDGRLNLDITADLNIDCNSERYEKYRVYASAMVLLYPVGVPAAYLFFAKHVATV